MYFSSQKFVYQQFFGMRTKYKQFHWFSSLLTKRDACTNTAQSSLRGVQMMMIATIGARIKSIQMCVLCGAIQMKSYIQVWMLPSVVTVQTQIRLERFWIQNQSQIGSVHTVM